MRRTETSCFDSHGEGRARNGSGEDGTASESRGLEAGLPENEPRVWVSQQELEMAFVTCLYVSPQRGAAFRSNVYTLFSPFSPFSIME